MLNRIVKTVDTLKELVLANVVGESTRLYAPLDQVRLDAVDVGDMPALAGQLPMPQLLHTSTAQPASGHAATGDSRSAVHCRRPGLERLKACTAPRLDALTNRRAPSAATGEDVAVMLPAAATLAPVRASMRRVSASGVGTMSVPPTSVATLLSSRSARDQRDSRVRPL